ncbi:uncharacterized protein TRIADDRAFT_57064 [Trichoplax adhaerens]|uniref:Uncharacterized protein n=1 Tax=Trichoplax adhaerens TaxID=10228 RepID=B3S0I8_TRIAD|nr:hypothetical protein TRIADDRAFT_57064 [Trichoplax adhaerens]EDV24016.1 hypothetical protein TRIADDRAFT_57064 [Trichoplax adhaerens]|eukprot:XP_002113542.1 hypothetical protein TRIADDRAFT_57064 [Trichoplax adhaerens]
MTEMRKSNSISYLPVHQMPTQYREPYILTGYREPCSTCKSCLRSLIRASNETLNVWTHFLPIIYFLNRAIQFYSNNDSGCFEFQYYPFMPNYIGIIFYHLASSIAHLFCSMSIKYRHTCFYIDYSGICIYAMGAGITYYNLYVLPNAPTNNYPLSQIAFTILSFGVSLSVCLVSCISRHYWRSTGAVIRTGAFAINLIFNTSPSLWLFWQNQLPSATHLVRQWSWYVAAITAYVFKIPEKFAPGKFDVIGHSHQWFHVFLSLGTVEQINSLEFDVNACRPKYMPSDAPSFFITIGSMMLAILLNALIVSICSYKLARHAKMD